MTQAVEAPRPAARTSQRLLVVGGEGPLTRLLGERLASAVGVESCTVTTRAAAAAAGDVRQRRVDGLVYLAAERGSDVGEPDLQDAGALLRELGEHPFTRVLLISSAAVNEPHHTHPGMVDGRWMSLSDFEHWHIQSTLEHTDYNQAAAARLLQIDRGSLLRRVKKYGLDVSRSLRGRPRKPK